MDLLVTQYCGFTLIREPGHWHVFQPCGAWLDSAPTKSAAKSLVTAAQLARFNAHCDALRERSRRPDRA
jgi:hypothetical protein